MIKWHVDDAKGLRVCGDYGHRTRQAARLTKLQLEKEALEDWNADLSYPLKIIREEWELKSSKVVR